jgi:hypothetical protein
MESVVYTTNFYLAISLAILAAFLIFLLVYFVFFKGPKKNKFDPKDAPVEKKSSKKAKKFLFQKKIQQTNGMIPQSQTPKDVPVRRSMPDFNSSKTNKKT